MKNVTVTEAFTGTVEATSKALRISDGIFVLGDSKYAFPATTLPLGSANVWPKGTTHVTLDARIEVVGEDGELEAGIGFEVSTREPSAMTIAVVEL